MLGLGHQFAVESLPALEASAKPVVRPIAVLFGKQIHDLVPRFPAKLGVERGFEALSEWVLVSIGLRTWRVVVFSYQV
jgi:hypothetical protein